MLTRFYDEEKDCYGFRNEHGAMVIPAVYNKVEDFESGLAVVQSDANWEWGLIDEGGEIVIPFQYDFVIVYKGWVHAAKEKENFLFNTDGKLILRISNILFWHFPREEMIQVKKETGWGVINLKGETVIDFIYRSIGPCINGWLSYYDEGRWGWLSHKGGIAVNASFDEVGAMDHQRWWGKKGRICHIYDYEKNELGTESWENIKDGKEK